MPVFWKFLPDYEILLVRLNPEWQLGSQVNISTPEDGWHEEWTSDDFMALPELVSVAYENQQYNPKLQYLTGVARDDASYLLCKLPRSTTRFPSISFLIYYIK